MVVGGQQEEENCKEEAIEKDLDWDCGRDRDPVAPTASLPIEAEQKGARPVSNEFVGLVTSVLASVLLLLLSDSDSNC